MFGSEALHSHVSEKTSDFNAMYLIYHISLILNVNWVISVGRKCQWTFGENGDGAFRIHKQHID